MVLQGRFVFCSYLWLEGPWEKLPHMKVGAGWWGYLNMGNPLREKNLCFLLSLKFGQ